MREEILEEVGGMFSGKCTPRLVNPDPSSPALVSVTTPWAGCPCSQLEVQTALRAPQGGWELPGRGMRGGSAHPDRVRAKSARPAFLAILIIPACVLYFGGQRTFTLRICFYPTTCLRDTEHASIISG